MKAVGQKNLANQGNQKNHVNQPSQERENRMITLEVVVALFSIISIAVGAIVAIYKMWNRIDNTLIKQTIVLDNLVNEVSELKGYGDRITENEKQIALINQRCEFRGDNNE